MRAIDIEVVDDFFFYKERSLQQVIEYSGKNKSNLKFVYAEFEDGLARQAFTREFQVDLEEGNVGAYKGAVFEIHEATIMPLSSTLSLDTSNN